MKKNRITAGVVAILFGSFGVQHFYLGNTKKAICRLLITLFTAGIGATIFRIIGIVEGVNFLTMTNEEFDAYCKWGTTVNKYKLLLEYKGLCDTGMVSQQEFDLIKDQIMRCAK